MDKYKKREIIKKLKYKNLYGKPSYTQKQLARWYNTSTKTISRIIRENKINRKRR